MYFHVVKIELPFYNLHGYLTNSISNFTQLKSLVLYGNYLIGNIPMAINRIGCLELLDVTFNHLTGTIPNIDNLSNLIMLRGGENSFYGTLPTILSQSITEISLAFNHLTGSLSIDYGYLTSLEIIILNNNYLTGTIPLTWYNLQNLSYLLIANNFLSGSISSLISNFQTLHLISIVYNYFTHTIPSSLTTLQQLTFLDISYNQFTGIIPDNFNFSYSLLWIYLSQNLLTHTLPQSLCHLTELTNVQITHNFLSHTLPTCYGRLLNLISLKMSHNLLTGTMPTSYSNIILLHVLSISNNILNGNLYNRFNSSQQLFLTIIEISDNQFTGYIPYEIYQLPSLNTFIAVTNCFSTYINHSICLCSTLQTLVLDGLQTASSCKSYLFPLLSRTYHLNYHDAYSIPPCIFNMTNIRILHLSGNGYIGSIIL